MMHFRSSEGKVLVPKGKRNGNSFWIFSILKLSFIAVPSIVIVEWPAAFDLHVFTFTFQYFQHTENMNNSWRNISIQIQKLTLYVFTKVLADMEMQFIQLVLPRIIES